MNMCNNLEIIVCSATFREILECSIKKIQREVFCERKATSAKGHATLIIVSKQSSQEDFCFAEKGEQDYDRTKLLGSTDELRITSSYLLLTIPCLFFT